eukprot:gene30421-35426_t
MEKAKAAGTPQNIIDIVSTPEFLHSCLRKAKLDPDLVQDVVDACDMNELTAIYLGSGELADGEAEEKLFLMEDEARSILAICKRQCLKAGVKFGDGSVYEPSPEDDEEEPEPPAASTPAPKPTASRPASEVMPVAQPLHVAEITHVANKTALEPASSGPPEDAPADPINYASVVKHSAHSPSKNVATATTIPAPATSAKPVSRATTPKASLPKAAVPAKSGATRTASNTTSTAAVTSSPAAKSVARPASAVARASRTPTPEKVKTPTSTARPASAAKESKPRPQSAPAKPTPSYARPTKSQQARVEGAEEPSPSLAGTPEPSTSKASTPPPRRPTPPKPELPKPKRQPRASVFANISSSLLRPTKAFLSWAGGNKKEDGADVSMNTAIKGGSQRVTSGGGAGGRGGGAKSMGPGLVNAGSRLSTSTKSKAQNIAELKAAKALGKPLSTEDTQILKAHEESGGGFRARPVPKSGTRKDTPTTSSISGPPANGSTTPRTSVNTAKSGEAPEAAAAAGDAAVGGVATPTSERSASTPELAEADLVAEQEAEPVAEAERVAEAGAEPVAA